MPVFSVTSTLSTSSLTPLLRPFTWQLAKDIRSKTPDLQEAFLDSLSLLALLSTANSPEPAEPKSFKKAVSENNLYQKDYMKAMQEEIDSVNANKTWILTDFPVGRTALDGRWVYKVK